MYRSLLNKFLLTRLAQEEKSIAQKSCLPALVALHFLQTTYSSKAATKNQIKHHGKTNFVKIHKFAC
jgi:hypothetical protein